MRLRQLASQLGCDLVGDGEIEITGLAGMEHAVPEQLTFLANPTYAPNVKDTRASAILINQPVRDLPISSLISSNPYVDFVRSLELFYQPPRPAPGIHRLAYVAPTARVGGDASIGPFAVVGERVTLGSNAVLHPHAVIYEGAQIGDDFLAHSMPWFTSSAASAIA
jgi:UDP-3-O-[3-hydroxymyristoyl] glucosamine N-acyltransferase